MRRISNETIWAVVASIVCGALLASLLGGTWLPFLVVVVALGLGLAVTIVRRRRHMHAPHALATGAGSREGRKATPDHRQAEDAPSQPNEGTGSRTAWPVDATARRMGARAQSLGARPAAPGQDRHP